MPGVSPGPSRRVLTWLAGTGLALIGAWHSVLAPLPVLTRLELALQDLHAIRLAEARAQTGEHPQIVIVDIDEHSLAIEGHWPWSRSRLATLTRQLHQEQGVAALAYDLVFPEPTPEDTVLAQALAGTPTVLGCYFSAHPQRQGQLPPPWLASPPTPPTSVSARSGIPPWAGYASNTAVLARSAAATGCFNVLPDVDGLTRSVPALGMLDGQLYPSLDLALLSLVAGPAPITADWQTPNRLAALRQAATPTQIARRWPLDERGQWHVPFGHRFRHVSASSVLSGELAPRSLQGQIVLVGSSAPGLGDVRGTPVHPAMPGVEVHALLLAGLLDGDLPVRPDWAPGWELSLIVLSLMAAGWSARRRSAPRALWAAAAWALVLAALPTWLAQQHQLLLPSASAWVLAGVFFSALLTQNYWHGWRRRVALEQLFRQYLPPAKARQLARHPEAAPAEARMAELTVLFCDLRGFSQLAESLPPMALRELLNQYFSTVTRLVHAQGGTLDKFIGDAVMAFWGAPEAQHDHARRAVDTALALLDALPLLNQHLHGLQLPQIELGIGLATGVVCVGDLGSDLRRSYTAVGDAVNVAARLEALTREAGVPLLVAASTRAACGPAADAWAWLELARNHVRGRHQSVTIFTVDRLSPHRADLQQAQSRTWALALASARSQDEFSTRAQLARLHDLMAGPEPTPRWTATLAALSASLAKPGAQPPPEQAS